VADTGLPWELPYPLPTDLVRDGADAIKDLAEATATGLSAAGGLVAVKHALFTGTQTAALGTSENVAVTSLSITHSLADASNKLIISAYIGAGGASGGLGMLGIGVADNGTLVGVGAAEGGRTQVAAGGVVSSGATVQIVAMPSITFVYEPGDTASHTYTVRAINIDGARTLYINRNESDTSNAFNSRASSGFVVQEVKV
jgi:hypothetical protein